MAERKLSPGWGTFRDKHGGWHIVLLLCEDDAEMLVVGCFGVTHFVDHYGNATQWDKEFDQPEQIIANIEPPPHFDPFDAGTWTPILNEPPTFTSPSVAPLL